MAILWDESLATGNDLIDGQHKELFARVNGLLEACTHGRGREVVTGTLAYLEDYTRQHFAAEEREMKASLYPGYETHRREHAAFVQRIGELRGRIASSKTGTDLVVLTNGTVVDWLIKHVKKVDKALADHLRKRAG